MQIKISQASEELTKLDKLAQVLYDFFNFDVRSDMLVSGIFTKPYMDESSNTPPNPEDYEYLYDKLEHVNGEPTPQIYAWRKWGYKAQSLVNRLDQKGYEIHEIQKVD